MITAVDLKNGDNDALLIAAIAIEHRGSFKDMEVSLRCRGPLPKMLHEAFGGSCPFHVQYEHDEEGNRTKELEAQMFWFRIRGEGAAKLLELLHPYFLFSSDKALGVLKAYRSRKPPAEG